MDSDVERALQHAIGQANSAFVIGVPSTNVVVSQSKSKKKRARGGIGEETKRKRNKKSHGDEGLNAASASTHDTSSLAVHPIKPTKTRKQKREAVSSAAPSGVSALTGIDLSALMGGPSISGPSQTVEPIPMLTSPSHHHLSGNQVAQDLYYPQSFSKFSSEDSSLPPFNTNDDILRAFHDLDLSRLAGVLRSLDVPLSPLQSNLPLGDALHGGESTPFLGEASPTTSNPRTTTNSTAVPSSMKTRGAHDTSASSSVSKKRSTIKAIAQSSPAIGSSIGPSIATPEHTHLLATKWLSAAKLKALVETQGLVYKKGKFSALEEQSLKTAIENYRVNHGLSTDQLTELIFSKSKDENAFWPEITASVPARPIIAVYHHVHRIYHPLKYQGKWSEDEDAALLKAVQSHGQAWQKISSMVGRMAQDCRDRWKNHLAHRSERQHGHWTKEEEEELIRIVTEMTTKQGRNSDNDVFWGVVSQRMGNKRGRQQCRIKWTDSISKVLKNSGNVPRWSKYDCFILVNKVASLGVRDDSEIDWNKLPDSEWNLWSAHSMQRRWRSLKLSIKGHEAMAFGEILEILQQKHAQPPPRGAVALTRSREPKSLETIEEDKDSDSLVDE